MTPRILLAVATRVLTQLRRDHRTAAMLLVLPCVLITLLWWMFQDLPGDLFGRFGPALLAMFPFIVMFLVTSVTTLRERSSGTLERLLAMPMGKLDFLGGYAVAFGVVAAVQAALAVTLSVGPLGLDVAGPVWLLGLVAVADAVLGTALGLLVSAFARTEFQAVQFMPLFVIPQILLCGLFVPRADMPDVLHAISNVLPLSYATDAMQTLVVSTQTGDVWRDLAIVAGFGVGALALGAATLRRRTPRGSATRKHPGGPGGGGPLRLALPEQDRPRPGRTASGVRRSLSGMSLLRQPLLLLARSDQVKRLVSAMPVSAGIVRGYVPGEDTDAAVRATADLVDDNLRVSLDYLGEDTLDTDQADATVQAYLDALAALAARGLTRHAEVSVKLSAIGQAIVPHGHKIALENARTICRAARNAGTTVTLDMEDHTTTDATLATLRELRKDFPETGAVLQAYLHRTEADCRALAYEGSRVRICKGAYDEPAAVAFQSELEVDKSYVRCLKALMAGQGYPMVATHDPRMIRIASSLASRHGRHAGSYEFQMLYGVRPEEQRRLAGAGETVRVYIPYGTEWYGYLMRRLAERPQNLTFFVRSLISKK